jgi:hypothetical protein
MLTHPGTQRAEVEQWILHLFLNGDPWEDDQSMVWIFTPGTSLEDFCREAGAKLYQHLGRKPKPIGSVYFMNGSKAEGAFVDGSFLVLVPEGEKLTMPRTRRWCGIL